MEDITGIIIYILIAIVGLLASIYKKKQKRERHLSPPAGSETIYDETSESIGSDFDPFSGIFEEKVKEEYLADEPGKTEEGQMTFEKDEADNEFLMDDQEKAEAETFHQEYIEGEAMFKETEEIIQSDDNIKEGEQLIKETDILLERKDDEHIGDEKYFDLKKAIIYSEIINRREF